MWVHQNNTALKLYMQLNQTVSRDHFRGLLPDDSTNTVVCIEQVLPVGGIMVLRLESLASESPCVLRPVVTVFADEDEPARNGVHVPWSCDPHCELDIF